MRGYRKILPESVLHQVSALTSAPFLKFPGQSHFSSDRCLYFMAQEKSLFIRRTQLSLLLLSAKAFNMKSPSDCNMVDFNIFQDATTIFHLKMSRVARRKNNLSHMSCSSSMCRDPRFLLYVCTLCPLETHVGLIFLLKEVFASSLKAIPACLRC